MIADILVYSALAVYVGSSLWLLVYGINAYVMIHLHRKRSSAHRASERRLLAAFRRRLAESGNRDRYELPVVTTQLPIFNERHVIERLLRAVCAFDYPRDRHEIQVLDDSTDDTTAFTAGLVAELQAAGHDVHHLHRHRRLGYKAGALAAGMEKARGEFVAIFDADFVPPPDFLQNTVPFLVEDPACGFVQTRWGHRNRHYSLLTELVGIGIDGHFVVEQAARAWNGLFCNFNGTAGIWRMQAIREAGGWTADTLTEDLDLSYRALLAGWTPRYLLDIVTPAEIPTDINALKSQQRRWAKGSIQTALKVLPRVLASKEIGIFKKAQAFVHLSHYLIHLLILVMTILILPLILMLQLKFTTPFTLPAVGVMLLALLGPSSMYVYGQAVTGRSIGRTILLMPALIALGIGLAVNNGRAVLEGLFGSRGGEFVRTPKLGSLVESPEKGKEAPAMSPPDRPRAGYRQPLSRVFLLELFMGGWALAAFFGYFLTIGTLAGWMLLLQAVGFICVGVLSVRHHRGACKMGW